MRLLQAIELVKDRQSKESAGEEAAVLMEAARRHGLLIGKGGGLYRNVIRVTPPMNISRSDLGEFAPLLDDSLAEVRGASCQRDPHSVCLMQTRTSKVLSSTLKGTMVQLARTGVRV